MLAVKCSMFIVSNFLGYNFIKMATYKVIQDVEAEDHILGPLTLRQFIYALGAVFFFYLSFLALTKNAPIMLVILFPPGATAAFFAFPFKRDQPTEVWALAKLRFMIVPRRRLWSQSGVKELVKINVPKKIEKSLTNGLTQTEVHNRLQVLATTIDSRGWAVKNAAMPQNQNVVYSGNNTTDRLIDPGSIPKPVPDYDIAASDDMMDELNNPIAAQFTNLIDESSREHRQKLIDTLNDVRQQTQDPQWFQNEAEISNKLSQLKTIGNMPTANLHTLPSKPQQTQLTDQNPVNPDPTAQPVTSQKTATVQPQTPKDPAILNLAYNDDLNVATIANVANESKSSEGEIVINLH